MFRPRKMKIFPSHFPFVFSLGITCEKTGAQGYNQCVKIYSHF